VSSAEDAVNWLTEIQRAVGDAVDPAVAIEIHRAAEYAYQRCARYWGQAWGQLAAREAVKSVLTGIATENDPEVQAAYRAYRQAQEHADALFTASAGPDGTVESATPEGSAVELADYEANEVYEEYTNTSAEVRERHSAEVSQAWCESDTAFLTTHRAELETAWPEGAQSLQMPAAAKETLRTQDSQAAGRLARADFPGTVQPRPAESRRHASGTASTARRPRPRRLP
jgi:hypothetical protein